MKEESIVHEIEPASSATLDRERKLKIRKRVKKTTSFCSIYDVSLGNEAWKREIGVEDDKSEKVDSRKRAKRRKK